MFSFWLLSVSDPTKAGLATTGVEPAGTHNYQYGGEIFCICILPMIYFYEHKK